MIKDFQLVEREAASLGPQLNNQKSKLIYDHSAGKTILNEAPDLCRLEWPSNAIIFGSPIGGSVEIDRAILEKVDHLHIVAARLNFLHVGMET